MLQLGVITFIFLFIGKIIGLFPSLSWVWVIVAPFLVVCLTPLLVFLWAMTIIAIVFLIGLMGITLDR